MNVLFIDLGNVWGGQEIYSKNIMQGLKHKGHCVFSLSSSEKHSTDIDGFYFVSPKYSQFYLLAKKVSTIIKDKNIDIVHFNGNRALYLSFFCLKNGAVFLGTKHLPFTIEGKLTFKDRLAQVLCVGVLSKISKLICVAKATYNDLPKVLKKRSVIVLNGVKNYEQSPALPAHISDQPLTLCYVARLVEHKGIVNLLKAVESIIVNGLSIRLQIAGTGALQKEVEDYVSKYPDYISYFGFVSDPTDIYNNSHICCLPSTHEGMPLNILEAMSARLAILSTNIAGVNEVVNHKNGWLMVDNSSSTIEHNLIEILNNIKLIENKRQSARKDYEQFYNLDLMVEKTLDTYSELLNE